MRESFSLFLTTSRIFTVQYPPSLDIIVKISPYLDLLPWGEMFLRILSIGLTLLLKIKFLKSLIVVKSVRIAYRVSRIKEY